MPLLLTFIQNIFGGLFVVFLLLILNIVHVTQV